MRIVLGAVDSTQEFHNMGEDQRQNCEDPCISGMIKGENPKVEQKGQAKKESEETLEMIS